MYLRIKGNEFTEKLLREVSTITDCARLRPSEVSYDEKSRFVTLPVVRFPILKVRLIRNYTYDKNQPIHSTVVVRNVTECRIDDNTPPEMDEIMLLFGVSVKGDEVVVSSAEEDRGTTCYFITMTVTEIDIEIRDDHQVQTQCR